MGTLLSWDIFLEGYYRRMGLAKDLQGLQKIIKDNKWQAPGLAPDNVLIWQDKVIIVTNCDQLIVFATENMRNMNGYMPAEIIGKSPKMFQGPATTVEERRAIKTAIELQKPFEAEITNYRKDGSVYKCCIEGHPVFNARHQLVNFIAFETAG